MIYEQIITGFQHPESNMAIRSRRRRSGFTLVDVLLAVTLVTIISGAVLSNASNEITEAEVSITATDLKVIARGAEIFRNRNGRWPDPTYEANAPGDFEGLFDAITFARKPPLGVKENSRYGWYSALNGRYALVYATLVDSDQAHKIDVRIDDGDPDEGSVRVFSYQLGSRKVATVVYTLQPLAIRADS